MNFSQHELGKRLRAARENCGISQQIAGDALGLPRTAITQIEAGNRSVSTLELAQLSSLYKQSIGHFFADESVEVDDPAVALYRMAPGIEANTAIKRQVDYCLAMCQTGRQLEDILGPAQQTGLFGYRLSPPRNTAEAVVQGQQIAAQERQRLNLGNAPIADMADLLNDIGIWASGVVLPDEMSGLFLHHQSIGLAILVNFKHLRARKRFSYAHEYAHALVDRDRTVTVSSRDNASELVEKRANAFAAAFLMPSSGVLESIGHLNKGQPSRQDQAIFNVATGDVIDAQLRTVSGSQTITYQDIAFVAHRFGVSYQAAAYRLSSLGVISRDRCNALLDDESRGREILQHLKLFDDVDESEQDERRDRELKSHVARLAVEAYRQEEISRGKFLDIIKQLNLPGRSFIALAEATKEH